MRLPMGTATATIRAQLQRGQTQELHLDPTSTLERSQRASDVGEYRGAAAG